MDGRAFLISVRRWIIDIPPIGQESLCYMYVGSRGSGQWFREEKKVSLTHTVYLLSHREKFQYISIYSFLWIRG